MAMKSAFKRGQGVWGKGFKKGIPEVLGYPVTTMRGSGVTGTLELPGIGPGFRALETG